MAEVASTCGQISIDATRCISAIKLAMNKLGVPISPAVRGPAMPIPQEAHEKVEVVLRDVGLLTVREAG